MLNLQAVTRINAVLDELEALDFYKTSAPAKLAVLRLVLSMTDDEEKVRWLVRRMTSGIFPRWPGLSEMRACFCSRYRPADGLEVRSIIYPRGFPPDPEVKRAQIAAPPPRPLVAGEYVSADPELDNVVRDLVKATTRPRVYGPPIPTDVQPGESELHALQRVMRELPKPAGVAIRPATAHKITELKRRQLENAQNAETRAILQAPSDEPQQ